MIRVAHDDKGSGVEVICGFEEPGGMRLKVTIKRWQTRKEDRTSWTSTYMVTKVPTVQPRSKYVNKEQRKKVG